MGILRLLLAIAVFLFHDGLLKSLGIPTLDGIAAVFCFFVVSGFYMEMVLVEKYNFKRLGPNYVKKFWLARFWRLYPTYILISLVVVALAITTPFVQLPNILDFNNSGLLDYVRSLVTWFFNLTMLFLNLPSSNDLLIGPGWSLGIEIAFYAIAPFALRLKSFPLIGISIISIALQLTPYGSHSPLLYGFHFFLLGALARRHTPNIELLVSRIGNPPLLLLYGVVFFLVFAAFPYEIYVGPGGSHAHNSLSSLIYPLSMGLLIPLLHQRTSNNKIDQWIGQLSYPFYLVHELVLKAFSNWTNDLKTLFLLLLCLGISVILMLLEARFVEPWRSRFAR